MRKSFLVLLIVTAAVAVSFGQVNFKPGVGIGFTDYVNWDGGAAAKVGTQIGGSVAFGKKFYVEPGVFYSVRSTEFTSNTDTEMSEAKIKGIRVPVSVGVGVLGNEESLAELRVFGGGSGFFKTGTENVDEDNVKSPSWGAFVGAGVDIWILYLDASYEFSFSEASSVMPDSKARTMYVTVGLKF
jgi:hypothetical protein